MSFDGTRPMLQRWGSVVRIVTATYSLEVLEGDPQFARAPYVRLHDAQGERWSKLCLLASVSRAGVVDETIEVGLLTLTEVDAGVLVENTQRSTAWESKTVRLLCTADSIELSVEVSGAGAITDVTLFGGAAALVSGAAGSFRSSVVAPSLFVPGPSEPVQFVRPSGSAAVLGVAGDADPGRLNGIFSPAPLALGFGRAPVLGPTSLPDGDWLALWLRAPVDSLTFTTCTYEPVDGAFLLRLAYEGHTAASGSWTTPTVVLAASGSALGIVDDYRNDLLAHGLAPEAAPSDPAAWWREPIFCGWGVQHARYSDDRRATALGAPAPLSAPDRATQDAYDGFLATLADARLDPGTIVIDDRWQDEYGTAEPDAERWPDLRGWIAARHAEGRRVLLWWKAWDATGLPPEECVTDSLGRAVSVDPANPLYRAHLEAIVERLLGPAGLDADGFKVDFTQRAPSGQGLRAAEGAWGIAALHLLLETIYAAAKRAKPDALVVTHAVHPSFGDVADMIRLNDVLERQPNRDFVPAVDQFRLRADIVGHALPQLLIDTDQWRLRNREEWLDYVDVQPELGVPALYYLESIDTSGERIRSEDLERVANSWRRYRNEKR